MRGSPFPFKAALVALLVLAAGELSAQAPREDILKANLDPSVNPAVDFFEYANGGWFKRNPIPASEASWSIGQVLREQLYVNLRQVNEQAAAARPASSREAQQIGDFWATAMDVALADRLGLEPLRTELAKVDALKSRQAALDVAFGWKPLGVEAFFEFYVGQDAKDSEVMAVHLNQGGLGLPERDFYFNPDKGIQGIREAYLAHIGRVLALLGRKDTAAKAAAERVLAFETELAKASRKLEDLRDPQKNYHKLTPGEFTTKNSPVIDWKTRLGAWGLRPSYVLVGQPEFFSALNGLVSSAPLEVLQDYLRVRLIATYGEYLSRPFEEEHFKFYRQALSGQKVPRERWKDVLDAQEQAMGMVLGKLFVKAYFPAAAKQRYSDMVEAIRLAYQDRIDHLDWMSEATKTRAKAKLAAMKKKVGYPDTWKDFSSLVIARQSYCQNMMSARRWRFSDMLAKFGKPVDRTEWHMTPQTYNAYYSWSNNEIVLPAAQFMVPGWADVDLDDALVYGYSAASTIGHEITHGFDDQGRKFDAQGNLKDWWTEEDAARFKAKSELLVKQFDEFEPLPGLHINGQASLGENIADYGGLLLGMDAFKKTEQYQKGERIAGLTPMQRYFLGYALGWLLQPREETLRRSLLSDVHAPAKWRVNGPFSIIPEFHEAFGVTQGQPMWRPEAGRAHIW